jgi:hypothetical protein
MSLLEGMVGALLSCPLFEFCIVNPFALPVLFLLLLACPALLAASPPLSPDQDKILEAIRASALQYTQKLPDFMCTQITHRQVSSLGNSASNLTGVSGRGGGILGMAGSAPNRSDVIEERLTFIDQKEDYTVIAVNGHKVAGFDHWQFQGVISAGAFGTDLHNIFDPRSGTVFTWERPGALHGHRVYRYSFHVPAQHGAIVVDRNSSRQALAAYAGRVLVDATILEVLLIDYRIDPPLGSLIRDSAISIEYRPVAIAGRSYMLPFRSEVRMQDQSSQYVNSIDFRSYHKFAVESNLGQQPHNRRLPRRDPLPIELWRLPWPMILSKRLSQLRSGCGGV